MLSLLELPTIESHMPPIWVDVMSINIRGDVGVATLTFESVLPERGQRVEAIRLQTSVPHIKSMINVLAKAIETTESHKKQPAERIKTKKIKQK